MGTRQQPLAPHMLIRTSLVCALALVFNVFFSLEKHLAPLVAVNPFTNDPYDAIGSLAIQVTAILAVIAALRAIYLRRSSASQTQLVILVRTQMAATLAVILALVADGVALARHHSVWLGSPLGYTLSVLVIALLAVAFLVAAIVQRANQMISLPTVGGRWLRAAIICIASLAFLAVYPEGITSNTAIHGAVLTVLIGGALLIVPLWALLTALSPYRLNDLESVGWGWMRRYWPWAMSVALAGAFIGLLVFVGEGVSEGAPHGGSRILHTALIYMGLEGSGVILTYLFLCLALRLFPPFGSPRSAP